jgi:hypothetical protein
LLPPPSHASASNWHPKLGVDTIRKRAVDAEQEAQCGFVADKILHAAKNQLANTRIAKTKIQD